MKRSWPVLAFLVFCCLFSPGLATCQTGDVALAEAARTADESKADDNSAFSYFLDSLNVPVVIQDVMQLSQKKYLEGSSLIKLGESEKARQSFNKAVDFLLQSEWDLASTPVLNRFFQDLILRIQQDESLYLQIPSGAADSSEGAVVDELDQVDLIPISVDPSLQDAVAADLANTSYDIPIMLNERVLKSLNYWLGRGREYFIGGLYRSGRYLPMIEAIFREESIPLDLIYLAQVESLFKTNAVSSAQAKGIWQFGKWTGMKYGLKIDGYVDERSDPEKSTRAAARYLNDLYAMFRDWSLVLAAYNWGEGKVQRLIERSGLTDFWELAELKRKLPDETKNHVPLIMASIILAKSPEKYGLPSKLDQPLAYTEVSVSKSIDLRAAARLLDVTLNDLKQLNPSLKGLSTPPNYPDFKLKIPAESTSDLCEKVAALPPVKFAPPADYTARYKVQLGDTFAKIAGRYRVSVSEIQRANRGINPKDLQAGSYIWVPSRASSAGIASTNSQAAAGRLAEPPRDYTARYKILQGDTFAKIAARYGISVSELQKANRGIDPKVLQAGRYIWVPSSPSSAKPAPSG